MILIDNAVDHSPANGVVRLVLRAPARLATARRSRWSTRGRESRHANATRDLRAIRQAAATAPHRRQHGPRARHRADARGPAARVDRDRRRAGGGAVFSVTFRTATRVERRLGQASRRVDRHDRLRRSERSHARIARSRPLRPREPAHDVPARHQDVVAHVHLGLHRPADLDSSDRPGDEHALGVHDLGHPPGERQAHARVLETHRPTATRNGRVADSTTIAPAACPGCPNGHGTRGSRSPPGMAPIRAIHRPSMGHRPYGRKLLTARVVPVRSGRSDRHVRRCRGPMLSVAARPAAPTDDKRWKIVETRMRRLGDKPDALIEVLHAAQQTFGYLDDDAALCRRVAGRAALQGVRRRHVLLVLHPQAQGRAHLRRLHRDGVPHQRRAPGSSPGSARRSGSSRGDDRGRAGLAARPRGASAPAASRRR